MATMSGRLGTCCEGRKLQGRKSTSIAVHQEPGTFPKILLLIMITTLENKYCYHHSLFIDKETDAQRGKFIFSRWQSQ